jgi:hypothetical protein
MTAAPSVFGAGCGTVRQVIAAVQLAAELIRLPIGHGSARKRTPFGLERTSFGRLPAPFGVS